MKSIKVLPHLVSLYYLEQHIRESFWILNGRISNSHCTKHVWYSDSHCDFKLYVYFQDKVLPKKSTEITFKYLNATGSNAGSSCAINLRLELANEGHRADKFLTRICESTVVAKVCLKQKSRRQIRFKGC